MADEESQDHIVFNMRSCYQSYIATESGNTTPLAWPSTVPRSLGASGPRGRVMQRCKVYLPVCAFILLAACIMASIGLVWMQITLKQNLDLLREQMSAVESSQLNSDQEIPNTNEYLIWKHKQPDEAVSVELGLNKLWTKINDMNSEIFQLSIEVGQLRANLKSPSDLINLLKKMEELQKSVAALGSTLTTAHHDVENLQASSEEQRKLLETLQKQVVESFLEELNATIVYNQQLNVLRLHSIGDTVSNISQRVSNLESNLFLLGQREKEKAPGPNPKKEEVSVSEIQEQLQLIHALLTKPAADKVTGAGKTEGNGTETAQSSPVQKNPRSLKRKLQHTSPPPAGTIRKAGEIYINRVKGRSVTPELHAMKEYDEDGDGLFSLAELSGLAAV